MPYQIKALAGKPFRPSNGEEGQMFMEAFCYVCAHYQNEVGCPIASATMWAEIGEPDYPNQWDHDKDGGPRCRAYREKLCATK